MVESNNPENKVSSFKIYPANQGKIILDATCAPADIRYPTDLSLLNKAREKLDDIIDAVRKTLGKPGRRPRTYRQVARKAYLSIVRNKMARLKETAETVICLQFLVMNLEHKLRVLFFFLGYTPNIES